MSEAFDGLTLETEVTKLFGIKYPILLAGMNKASGPELAAAVSNAGGLGVIGGHTLTPRVLKLTIRVLKKHLKKPGLPFGVDLLLPKLGKGARATNYDYSKGQLDKLIDVICESGAKLFVSAVGVPDKSIVDKLHSKGIFVMNMVGHPKHVKHACAAGVDLVCAQGGEGGGHTGSVPTSLLLPKCADLCRRYISPLTGKPVLLVGAGGIYDGRSLAMALSLGAKAVWVGTRFVASVEAGASTAHKQAVVKAGYDDTHRTLVFTGRPMRVIDNPYAKMWETKRKKLHDKLLAEGTVPTEFDRAMLAKASQSGKGKKPSAEEKLAGARRLAKAETAVWPKLSGQVCGAIDDIKPAAEIIEEMVSQAIRVLRTNYALITPIKVASKL